MPRIRIPSRYRALVIWTGAAVLCALSCVVLWLAAQIEARMIRQESTPSVCEPSPLERAVMPIAEAWREENRLKR